MGEVQTWESSKAGGMYGSKCMSRTEVSRNEDKEKRDTDRIREAQESGVWPTLTGNELRPTITWNFPISVSCAKALKKSWLFWWLESCSWAQDTGQRLSSTSPEQLCGGCPTHPEPLGAMWEMHKQLCSSLSGFSGMRRKTISVGKAWSKPALPGRGSASRIGSKITSTLGSTARITILIHTYRTVLVMFTEKSVLLSSAVLTPSLVSMFTFAALETELELYPNLQTVVSIGCRVILKD